MAKRDGPKDRKQAEKSDLLADIPVVPAPVARCLAGFAIFSAEQLQYTAGVRSVRAKLRKVVSEAGGDLSKILATLPKIAMRDDVLKPHWTRGALFPTDEIEAEIEARAASARQNLWSLTSPPSSVNMSNEMPPVRNQGDRGTCVAFAITAVHEHFRAQIDTSQDLSEQFLYEETKRVDGSAECGTWMIRAAQVLSSIGEARESIWPYNSYLPCNNNGIEPANARLDAAQFKTITFVLSPGDLQVIKSTLAGGACVGISISVYNSWYDNLLLRRNGSITMPLPGEARNGGHAVCLVGYQDDGKWPGGGYFILRNSWGTSFGSQSVYGAGYGTIPYAYAFHEAVTVPGPPPARAGRALPFFRYWSSLNTDHFYTANWAELGRGAAGWGFEGVQGYVLPLETGGAVPFYRYWNSQVGDHFYSTNWNELGNGAAGWVYEGVQGYVRDRPSPRTVPLYRYWNPQIGDHFYTTNWGELGSGSGGWSYEGIACYIFTDADPTLPGTELFIAPPSGDCMTGDIPGTFDWHERTDSVANVNAPIRIGAADGFADKGKSSAERSSAWTDFSGFTAVDHLATIFAHEHLDNPRL